MFMTRPAKKAQSAMEYLMTYGWAILIIAVVLAALFYLGVFNGTSFNGNTCIAGAGYLCSSPQYSHSTGNIVVTIGQSTGIGWTSVNVVYIPQGTPNYASGAPAVSFNAFPANTILSSSGLANGGEQSFTLPATTPNVPVGTAITGTIWVQYVTKNYNTGVTQSGYAEIAAMTIKAT